MDTRAMLLTIVFAGALMASTVQAGQQEQHQAAGTDATGTPAVAQCRQVQPVVTATIEGALKRLEEARLTNSPAVMRSATDSLQAALLDIRTQLAPCAQLQVPTSEGHAGHVMPNVQQALGTVAPGASATPNAAPGAAAPGAPTAAEPHAGHVTPGASQAPPRAAPQPPPGPAQKPGASSGAQTRPQHAPTTGTSGGEHAGHAAPAAPPAAKAASARAPSDTRSAAAPVPPAEPLKVGTRTTASNPATDLKGLVCANEVDSKTAPRMLYRGRMYYFCSDADRAEFAKSPDRYVTAPSTEKAPPHRH